MDRKSVRKIIKIVATKCKILRLKCTKIDFDSYSAHSDPLALIKAAYFQGKERGAGSRKGGWEGSDKKWRGRNWKRPRVYL